jgi:hypothetical protein
VVLVGSDSGEESMRVGWIEAVAGGQTCGVEADCERRLSAAPVGAVSVRHRIDLVGRLGLGLADDDVLSGYR